MSFPTECPDCGAKLRLLDKYRDEAFTCPECGERFVAELAEPPKKRGPSTWLVLSLVLGGVTVVFCGGCAALAILGGRMHVRSGATTEPETVAQRVSTEELFADYDGNAINADVLYKGRLVEVTGEVERIDEGFLGGPYVALHTRHPNFPLWTAHCEFSSEQKRQLGQLDKHQTVTIRGRCKGKSLLSVRLSECTLVR